MKIAIIGYGKEGRANEVYFRRPEHGGGENEIEVISSYEDEDYEKYDFSQYDLVLRSPSVRPRPEFSSGTRYFFEHCLAPIIGVTGTKGKGTTCTMIAEMLKAMGKKVFLLGNIGTPAISKLDEITKDDVVVYELSSFQLWDLTQSPRVAVILRIAPDHLNVHRDMEEYLQAKGNIARYQGVGDSVVACREDENSCRLAETSKGKKIFYPMTKEGEKLDAKRKVGLVDDDGMSEEEKQRLCRLLDALMVPGAHNREDAEAALAAMAAFLEMPRGKMVTEHFEELRKALANFKGLPHHIEFVRELRGVSYYDDSFSTAEPALEVAIKAFSERPLVLIAGGEDKGVKLTETKRVIFGASNLKQVFLIGEIAKKLAVGEDEKKFTIVKSLAEAVLGARAVGEKFGAVVLLSPGAASHDMFKDYYERGEEFQRLVRELK